MSQIAAYGLGLCCLRHWGHRFEAKLQHLRLVPKKFDE